MSTYDDWKTTDPDDAQTCPAGHWHCDGDHGDREGGALVVCVKVLEPFEFADGVRLAWVWWLIGAGERRAVHVQACSSGDAFAAFVRANAPRGCVRGQCTTTATCEEAGACMASPAVTP